MDSITPILVTTTKCILQISICAAFGAYTGNRGWDKLSFWTGMAVISPLTYLILFWWLP